MFILTYLWFNRLETTYRQFEIKVQYEEKMVDCTNIQPKHPSSDPLDSKESIPKLNVIEVDSSSDEEGMQVIPSRSTVHTRNNN